ncbi:MAG: peptidylprolyl isomerase [Castellaniella sp.]
MPRLFIRPLWALVLWIVMLGVSPAQPVTPQTGSRAFVDGIAAVVNKRVITLQQVAIEAAHARDQLRRQNIPVPEGDALEKQVLQRLIGQELQRQEAQRLGIQVSEKDIGIALESIAARNRLSIDQLRREVEAGGTPWDRYMEDLEHDVQLEMLRQRAVDSTIFISDADVDAFLRSRGASSMMQGGQALSAPAGAAPAAAGPRSIALAQILVAVPEGSSTAERAQLRARAESLLQRVQRGEDFAGVAAEASDGPEAFEGGVLGERPVEGWPDLFIEATRDLGVGGISAIVGSGNGFHILKVIGMDAPATSAPAAAAPAAAAGMPAMPASTIVTQTHARHILIKTSQVMSDEKAEEQLRLLRARAAHGESFADLARRHSEDASAPQGGDLGWLNPGETVPAFERAMDALAPGEISEPVQSNFGWHLIRVEERREKDVGDEALRAQARQILFQRRVEPAMEDWLSHLWGQAYIDNRLDPGANRRQRR